MFNDVRDLLWDPDIFLEKLFLNLKNDWIDISKYQLDHICYRVETVWEYNTICEQLLWYGKILSEAIINWRPISTYKLNLPIEYKLREIYCIEIPSPSPHANYSNWYEHIEFVIDEDLFDFASRYKHLEFKMKWINKKIIQILVENT